MTVCDGKIHILGRQDGHGESTNRLFTFDPSSGQVEAQLSLLCHTSSHSCITIVQSLAGDSDSDRLSREQREEDELSLAALLSSRHLHVDGPLPGCPLSYRNKTSLKGQLCAPARACSAWRSVCSSL